MYRHFLRYLSHVLHFHPPFCGLITLIPLSILLLIKGATGYLSDTLQCIQEVTDVIGLAENVFLRSQKFDCSTRWLSSEVRYSS